MTAQTESVHDGEFEAEVILMDKDSRPNVTVQGTFLPHIRSVSFRLPPSSEVDRIIASTGFLRMMDGRLCLLKNGHRCSAHHSVSPEQPHVTFDYEPLN
jgi:hypothetical protein